MRPPPSSWLLCSALLIAGCTDLGDFSGSFRGRVVGTDDDSEDCDPPARPCSFIRRGFPAGTELSLQFVPPPSQRPPGTITTTDGSFERTPLEFIAPLEHDQLSLYDFPGGERLRNYIFVTRPASGPLAGREPMVFVSLMDRGDIEVRILAGSGDESRGDHFGIFNLDKQ